MGILGSSADFPFIDFYTHVNKSILFKTPPVYSCTRGVWNLYFVFQTQKRMTLLSNEDNKEISLSSELAQASTEKVRWLVRWQSTFKRYTKHSSFSTTGLKICGYWVAVMNKTCQSQTPLLEASFILSSEVFGGFAWFVAQLFWWPQMCRYHYQNYGCDIKQAGLNLFFCFFFFFFFFFCCFFSRFTV